MLEINYALEISLTVDLQGLVSVIAELANAYKDYATAVLMLKASKAFAKKQKL